MVETQLETVEAEKASQMQSELCTDCEMSQAYIKELLDSTTSQNRGSGRVRAQKMVIDDLLFNLFLTFSTLAHGPKNTRLKKIYITTRKSYLSEGNFIPSWRNIIGHLLLDTMDDSTACFTMITNNIFSNPRPHMVVPFLLVPLHWQKNVKRGRGRGYRHQLKKPSTKKSIKLDANPNL